MVVADRTPKTWRGSALLCLCLGAPALAPAEPSRPDPAVLTLALRATNCADSRGLVPHPTLVTVIDYTLPSTEPRLWVIERLTKRVIFQEQVAHGRGSGENYAERFSNRPGSYQTSLGLFLTGETYVGRNGYSLRLDGLERDINHLARERAIVMHGATYASPAFALQHGRLGRSWGCPAVRPGVVRELFDAISGGTPLFAYYADEKWLASSAFLNDCADDPDSRVGR
ncbi:MAG TPA: murein L,D-transpeptidase catalytic domain family protein [Vicinamibacteria bacterium]|nr:murein L,D-transpeptidase catalytic domain family protein [Vicinamibacteria bacterium]